MKIGITAGAFDLCHAGHMLAFRNAKNYCDKLIVALHRDPSVERPEKNKPVMSLQERHIILQGIHYIDSIIQYDTEAELVEILKLKRPDVRFLGEDWKGKSFTGHELNIPIVWEDRSHGYSSSELRKRIAIAEKGTVLEDMRRYLPDFADEHWPKGEGEDRGVAVTALALFLADYGSQGI